MTAGPEGATQLPSLNRPRVLRILGWIAVICVIVVAFEEVLNLTALKLFPHHDTADCAGANTFCSPNGQAGPTGGSIVFLVGNLGASGITFALLSLIAIRHRSAHARS